MANPVELVSQGYESSASFTPANTSHTAGDVVGGAQRFANIAPASGGKIVINYASCRLDNGTAEASAFRLYLFSVTPPSAVADDSPFTLASGDRASFLGYIDLGTPVDLGDTCFIQAPSLNFQVTTQGNDLFGYLVNLTTVSTAAAARVVTLRALQV